MSPAASTSREAYRDHAVSGRATTQRERILAFVRRAGQPVYRATIAHAFSFSYRNGMCFDAGLDIPLASVCGRVNAMIEDKSLRVLSEPARDPSTGHLVELLEAVWPAPKQRTFEDFMR